MNMDLAYGRRTFEFSFDEHRFSVLSPNRDREAPLNDFEIGAAFDSPIASPPLDEIAGADDSVLIVVSDATRATASAQVVNLLMRRLVQGGVSPVRTAVIFATGIHRPVSEKEKAELAIPAKRDIVIASCGGFPHDINMIQAHKALDMAALACNEGGTIILLAECGDGLGRPDFLKWFDESDSRALEARLVNGYEVNGQTAWALLTKAERYRVCLISDLPGDDVKRMRMIPVRTISEALEGAGDGFILPRGAAVLPRVQST